MGLQLISLIITVILVKITYGQDSSYNNNLYHHHHHHHVDHPDDYLINDHGKLAEVDPIFYQRYNNINHVYHNNPWARSFFKYFLKNRAQRRDKRQIDSYNNPYLYQQNQQVNTITPQQLLNYNYNNQPYPIGYNNPYIKQNNLISNYNKNNGYQQIEERQGNRFRVTTVRPRRPTQNRRKRPFRPTMAFF